MAASNTRQKLPPPTLPMIFHSFPIAIAYAVACMRQWEKVTMISVTPWRYRSGP